MKRDLLFMVERLTAMLDERRLAIVMRQHGIGKPKNSTETPAKVLAASSRKAEESILGRLLVESVILYSTQFTNDNGKTLKEAAEVYKVDVSTISAKVKQEFAVKDKAKTANQATPKPPASARTVQYHSQGIVPIHAKLKYTTLIELPATEKIMEAATGDKEFGVVDVVGNFCFVHPANAGGSGRRSQCDVHPSARLSDQLLKAFRAVERCRSAALGGHEDKCVGCQYEPPISPATPADHDVVPRTRRRSAGDGSMPNGGTC